MQDTTYQAVDAAPSAWLDVGCTTTSGTLHGGKANPPPPPPRPPEDDIIRGTDSDDTLEGGVGNDSLFGGKGEDTAVYSGVFNEYELSFDADTWEYKLVDKVSGRDGTDRLKAVERLQFDGITVLLGNDGGAHLPDGTVLLAPYVPPPPPEGWDTFIGNTELIVISDVLFTYPESEAVTAHWVTDSTAYSVELNGIAPLAAGMPLADA